MSLYLRRQKRPNWHVSYVKKFRFRFEHLARLRILKMDGYPTYPIQIKCYMGCHHLNKSFLRYGLGWQTPQLPRPKKNIRKESRLWWNPGLVSNNILSSIFVSNLMSLIKKKTNFTANKAVYLALENARLWNKAIEDTRTSHKRFNKW